MNKTKLSLLLITIIILISVVFFFTNKNKPAESSLGSDPLNTTYTIEGLKVNLVDGIAEQAIPSSQSKVVTRVFGSPYFGDMNEDGVKDAVVFLTQSGGGSGIFYYVAVSINKEEKYTGLDVAFLGDRIAPQNIQIKDGVAIVNYAERKADEPMTARPSVGVSKYLVVENNLLKDVGAFSQGDLIFSGGLVMGEGARVFTPCGGSEKWVIGSSIAYKKLMEAYNNRVMGTNPYEPLYVVLSGRIVDKPTDGFGADYDYGIEVSNLIKIPTGGKCPQN